MVSQEGSQGFSRADPTRSILEAAVGVQRSLGVGLLERAYQLCLAHVLARKGHRVRRDLLEDLEFQGLLVPDAYRINLLVDDAVIVEIKAVERLGAQHQASLLSCLRHSGKETGLLLNFWANPLREGGIQRFLRGKEPLP